MRPGPRPSLLCFFAAGLCFLQPVSVFSNDRSSDFLPQNWSLEKPRFTLGVLGSLALTGISEKDFGGTVEGLVRWSPWYAIGIQTSYVRLTESNDNWFRAVFVGDADILDFLFRIRPKIFNFFIRGDFGYARTGGRDAVEVVGFGLGTNIWVQKNWAIALLGSAHVDVGDFGFEDTMRGGFMLSTGLRHVF